MVLLINLVFISLAGIFVGSLLNVVIYRLPKTILEPETSGLNLWLPRSHCPQCRHTLAWYDNIPLLSWLMLHGRCRYCKKMISLCYPLTELGSMLLCLLLAFFIPSGNTLLAAWLLGWILLALTVIDVKYRLLPDLLTLTLLWLGLFFQLCGWLPHVSLQQSVSGAVVGYLLLWLLASLYRILRGNEGLGGGDAKLLAALGAWLGWQALPLLLLLASGGSLIWFGFNQLISRRAPADHLPFGPGLATAGLLLFIDTNLSSEARISLTLLFRL